MIDEVMDIVNNINLVKASKKKPLQPNFIAMSRQGAKKSSLRPTINLAQKKLKVRGQN